MTALRALFYADWRALVNEVRRGLRSAGRVALWISYAVLLGLFFWGRTVRAGRIDAPGVRADLVRADYFICALLAMLAFSLATGFGALGIFRSRAEARFIIGSPVPAPLAIAYLQAREALSQGLRLLLSFMYFIFLFGPRHGGPIALLADLLLMLAISSAVAAVVVPRRLLPRGPAVACVVAGIPLTLLASAPALRDVVALPGLPLPAAVRDRLIAAIPEWHPGQVLIEPNALWLLAALTISLAAVLLLASAGRDAYPELYALSIARIDRLERSRIRRDRSTRTAVPAARLRSVTILAPPGVLIFVWKAVVESVHRSKPQYIAGGGALWCVAGFVAARLVQSDNAALFAALCGVVINVLLVVGISATSTLAAEVRRPLFWLAPARLYDRLCALALARTWRTLITLELVAASFALGGGRLMGTLFLAIALPALVALLAAIGFAAFALFPSTVDLRGPVAGLRLVVSIVFLVPPLIAFVIAATVLRTAPTGLGGAALLALIEAGALMGIAAWRLDGRVDRLPA